MEPVFKRILLTGGAGFIGSHLLQNLIDKPQLEEITVIDSLVTGQKQNIQALLDHPRLNFIEHDATDFKWLGEFLESTDSQPYSLILHFASPASPPRYQAMPLMTYQVNAFTTHVLAQYATAYQSRMLFASTSEVYGDPQVSPQPESYWGNVNPNGVRSCYDESKRLGETICGEHHRQYQTDIRLVRIFNTYGPHMDPYDGRVIPSFLKSVIEDKPLTLFGDGTQTRSFCYVDDLVQGIIKYVSAPDLAGETINIGNPDEYSMQELIQEIEKMTGQQLKVELQPLPEDDPTQRRPDITKAQKLLGWQAKINLEQGLRLTYEDFKKQLAK